MKKKIFKKGERVNPFTVAGEDFFQLSKYGITCDVFDCGDHYKIPIFESELGGGSGKFANFLKELKDYLDKPIIVESVINFRIIPYLEEIGIKYN